MTDAVSTASCGQPQGQHDFLLRWMEQVVVNLLLDKCPFHFRHPTAANILQHCLPFPSFVSFFFCFSSVSSSSASNPPAPHLKIPGQFNRVSHTKIKFSRLFEVVFKANLKFSEKAENVRVPVFVF